MSTTRNLSPGPIARLNLSRLNRARARQVGPLNARGLEHQGDELRDAGEDRIAVEVAVEVPRIGGHEDLDLDAPAAVRQRQLSSMRDVELPHGETDCHEPPPPRRAAAIVQAARVASSSAVSRIARQLVKRRSGRRSIARITASASGAGVAGRSVLTGIGSARELGEGAADVGSLESVRGGGR